MPRAKIRLYPFLAFTALAGFAASSQLPAPVESAIQARIEVLEKAGAQPASPSEYKSASSQVSAARRGAAAQPLATFKDASGVAIAIQSTTDNRLPGQLNEPGIRTVSFIVSGPDLAAGAALRAIRLSKAVDSKGMDLLVVPTAAPAATAGRGVARPLGVTLSIRASDRDAKSLAILEGTAEIFSPTVANGGVVSVQIAGTKPGSPIAELLKHGIEFSVVMPDSVLINDPKALLVGYALRDSAGTVLPTVPTAGTRGASGTPYQLRFQAAGGGARGRVGTAAPAVPAAPAAPVRTEIPADGQIEFYLGLPGTTKSVPFRFENFAFP